MPTANKGRSKSERRRSLTQIQFADQWQSSMGRRSYSVEAIASVTQAAIKELLDKHFQYDNKRYTVDINRTLSDGQMDRKFLIRISAKAPIQVELPPFQRVGQVSEQQRRINRLYAVPRGWDELGITTPDSKLCAPRQEKGRVPDPNIRVLCPRFTFHIEWPKLHNNNESWKWDPPPLNFLAEAFITLEQDSDGPFLRIEPTRIKFEQAERFRLAQDLRNFIARLPANDRRLLGSEEDKFNDLLVIALNVAAVQFGPKLVRNVRLPMPVLAKKQIIPNLLDLENKMVTVGATIDLSEMAQKAETKTTAALAAFSEAVQRDIESNGGLRALVTKPGQSKKTPLSELKLLSRKQIASKLTNVRTLLSRIELEAQSTLDPSGSSGVRLSRLRDPAVPNGFGVAVSEYFLNSVVQAVMPKPKNKCEREHPFTPLMKGWVCYWAKLYNPSIVLNGVDIHGEVQVDVGGALHACIKRFWDCSYTWECGELDLSVQGNPGLDLHLDHGEGVVFSGQITGKLHLETNLPQPFKTIVSWFSKIIWDGIQVILNIFLSMISIEVFPPAITLPEQRTKISFSKFDPFAMVRNQPTTLPLPKRKYIGFGVGVTATG